MNYLARRKMRWAVRRAKAAHLKGFVAAEVTTLSGERDLGFRKEGSGTLYYGRAIKWNKPLPNEGVWYQRPSLESSVSLHVSPEGIALTEKDIRREHGSF